MSVHMTEAKFLLLEVSYTTLSPRIWHNKVSTHYWNQDSTARGQYYFIESQYLTLGVSIHPWDQVYPDTGQYYYIESQYLILEVSTHHWGKVYPATGQYYNNESQYLTQ